MEHRSLGKSGLQVSAVGLGCNNFGRQCDFDSTKAVVHRALDLGVTLFDTADVYGGGLSEEYLGRILGARRQDVIVATKFGVQRGEGGPTVSAPRHYILRAVEASLRRLNTDYIDLYQLHWPDPNTPIDEILDTLDTVVRQGKVRYIGHSNFAGWQVVQGHYAALERNTVRFVSAQNHYNLLQRSVEAELVPSCQAYGLSVLPYFPLASGFLTGKYRRNQERPAGSRLQTGAAADRIMSEKNWRMLERLEAFAKARDRTLVDLAVGWLASLPHVGSVIVGATRPDQVDQNVAAGEWRLSAGELGAIDALAQA
jgi:aryl-alcohol dehydrogenase-like predicted oxidoreductase